jgi:hypothetical protein
MSTSRKAQVLQKWTKDVESNMAQFRQGAELMVRKHQKSNIKTSSLAITLKDMSINEPSKNLRESLEQLSVGLSDLENHRLALLANLQFNIVNEFDKYSSRVKVQESNIQIRNKAYLEFNKKQRDYLATRGRASQQKQDHAKAMLEEERKRLQAAEDTINGSIGDFEKERLNDMKTFLKHFLNSHVYYHARAVEVYSQAFEKVMAIDSDSERTAWMSELKKYEMEDQSDDIPARTQ